MRGKLAVVGVAVVATLSGCSAVTTSVTTTTPSAAPKVTTSPTLMKVIAVATPKAHSGAPGLSTTGTNWMAIVKSLTGYGQWLLGNPDPSMIANAATPGCAMSDLLGRQVSGLLNSSTYVQTAAPAVTQVVGPSAAPANGTVNLAVVAGRAAEPVLSQKKGITITTIMAYPPTILRVTLDLGSDKKWRLCEVTGPGGAEAPLL